MLTGQFPMLMLLVQSWQTQNEFIGSVPMPNIRCLCLRAEALAHAASSAFETRQLLRQGEKRRPKGLRTRKLADLATPILTDAEIEWFVELKEKHARGGSTDWAAMLHDWNRKVLQLRLNPHTAPLAADVHPKQMGQLAAFEKQAYRVLNQQNSELSGLSLDPSQPAVTIPPTLTPFSPTFGITDHECSHAFFQQPSTANPFEHAAGVDGLRYPYGHFGAPATVGIYYPAYQIAPPVGTKRAAEVGPPNRGGLGTAKRCRICTKAEGRDVFMTGHRCPLKDRA